MFLIITFIPKQISIIQEQTSIQTAHCLAQPLAQARCARLGDPPSPRRGLEKASGNQRGISLSSLKNLAGRLGDLSRKRVWSSPCPSRLGETSSLGRD